MTKAELIRMNQTSYEEMLRRIGNMADGLEKAVAGTLMLAWFKGHKWLGGLDTAGEARSFKILEKMGYGAEESLEEFERQTEAWMTEHEDWY